MFELALASQLGMRRFRLNLSVHQRQTNNPQTILWCCRSIATRTAFDTGSMVHIAAKQKVRKLIGAFEKVALHSTFLTNSAPENFPPIKRASASPSRPTAPDRMSRAIDQPHARHSLHLILPANTGSKRTTQFPAPS
jgi:hypothetical protein